MKYRTCYSDCFDYPYCLSCTVDTYQHLISGDKRREECLVIVLSGCYLDVNIIRNIGEKINLY